MTNSRGLDRAFNPRPGLGAKAARRRVSAAALSLAGGLAMAGFAAAPSAQAASVELKDIAARVVVQPEDRTDVSVSVIKANPKLPLHVRQGAEGVVIVDRSAVDGWLGGLIQKSMSCHRTANGVIVRVPGAGRFSEAELPELLVRVPMDAKVSSSGAVIGSLPRANSLVLSTAGCDTWTIGDVKGRLQLDASGDGLVRTGNLGGAEIGISGTTSLFTRAVAQGLKADISGAGRINTASAGGDVNLHISGAGHVRIEEGHVTHLASSISGAGDVTVGGTVDAFKLSLSGVSKVRLANVITPPGAGEATGEADAAREAVLDLAGTGHVIIDNGHISRLRGEISGMGEVSFGGQADKVLMDVAGMGHVHVARSGKDAAPVNASMLGAARIDR